MWTAAAAAALAAMVTPALWSALVPVRATEMAYARVALRLTLAGGGAGRYGTVWGAWMRARVTPGLGYFQPDFQCAEYVMRALRAAGYAIATPGPEAAGWDDMVNVDRAIAYLRSRGIAEPTALGRLRIGDVVAFRYLRPGPNRWSHIALVTGTAPLRLSAHDRNRWNTPLSAVPSAQAVLGLRTRQRPQPPDGLRPLLGVRFAEVAWRDPPLRRRPGGAVRSRLFMGLTVAVNGVARSPGSETGWLHVRSGTLSGWLNGDYATRVGAAPVALAPGARLTLGRRTFTSAAQAPVRGAWGHRLFVDAQGCPAPDWTGPRCLAPYATMHRTSYPQYRVEARRTVLLTLSPEPGSVAVARLAPGQAAAAGFVGRYAALWAPGGPSRLGGVLYAPASAFTWRHGGIALFFRPVRLPGGTVPAETAGALVDGRLWTAAGALALPASGLSCAAAPGRPPCRILEPAGPSVPPPALAP